MLRTWCDQPIFLNEIVAGGERGSGRYKQVIPKHLQLLQRLPLSDEIFYELNTLWQISQRQEEPEQILGLWVAVFGWAY
jgi:hypothetical protein